MLLFLNAFSILPTFANDLIYRILSIVLYTIALFVYDNDMYVEYILWHISGTEYDSQDLHILLQRNYPDLYETIFLNNLHGSFDDGVCNVPKIGTTSSSPSPGRPSWATSSTATYSHPRFDEPTNCSMVNGSKTKIPDSARQTTTSHTTRCPSVELARRLFDCVNTLHSHQTTRLRSEVFDLSNRIRALQVGIFRARLYLVFFSPTIILISH